MLFVLGLTCLGVLGMTWLFPITSLGRWLAEQGRLELKVPRKPARRLAILIPCHNQFDELSATLSSIETATSFYRLNDPNLEVFVEVGLDGNSAKNFLYDQSKSQIKIRVHENLERSGKWSTLLSLFRKAPQADWFSFVDAGAIWQSNTLDQIVSRTSSPQIMAIAPTYRSAKTTFVNRVLWTFESHLKSIEALTSGPTSVHGATVFYRAKELQLALKRLEHHSWLNDDVVIPVMLHSLFPKQRIQYLPEVVVTDSWTDSDERASESLRRMRMARGNTQWVRRLLPGLMARNPGAAWIALRRVFRSAWAYWALLFAAMSGLFVPIAVLGTIGIIVLGIRNKTTAQNLIGTVWASLCFPILIFDSESGATRNLGVVKWK